MNIHLRIWIPGIISVFALTVADESGSIFWFLTWIILQLIALYYTWILLKNYKHRSGALILLPLFLNLLGILIIYLIPAKKIAPSSPSQE